MRQNRVILIGLRKGHTQLVGKVMDMAVCCHVGLHPIIEENMKHVFPPPPLVDCNAGIYIPNGLGGVSIEEIIVDDLKASKEDIILEPPMLHREPFSEPKKKAWKRNYKYHR